MTSLVQLECSGCGCDFNRRFIEILLLSEFPRDISKLISHLVANDTYRIMHNNHNEIPHVLCLECESFYLNIIKCTDTNNFTCPHPRCKRMIITG